MQCAENDNINIVMFDGKCYRQNDKYLFRLFNKSNFIIIAENENGPAIKQYCKDTRKNIIVKSEDYNELLADNIIKVLNMAIR